MSVGVKILLNLVLFFLMPAILVILGFYTFDPQFKLGIKNMVEYGKENPKIVAISMMPVLVSLGILAQSLSKISFEPDADDIENNREKLIRRIKVEQENQTILKKYELMPDISEKLKGVEKVH